MEERKTKRAKKAREFEPDSFIPLAAHDSTWQGIQFSRPALPDNNEDEDEVQSIDLESEEKEPLLTLFPELEKENIGAEISTTSLTKMLVGKQPDLSLLKKSQKLYFKPTQNKRVSVLETVSEEDSNFSS